MRLRNTSLIRPEEPSLNASRNLEVARSGVPEPAPEERQPSWGFLLRVGFLWALSPCTCARGARALRMVPMVRVSRLKHSSP